MPRSETFRKCQPLGGSIENASGSLHNTVGGNNEGAVDLRQLFHALSNARVADETLFLSVASERIVHLFVGEGKADLGEELGGAHDAEPIDFMTTHAEAYRQLADPTNVAAVRSAEERLTSIGRRYVPAARIAAVADRIQDGDIIAATSTVEGLDVAHTGLALWVDGTLRLLHAPLVGSAVQVSEVSLAERIGRIEGQDGILVARPVER